MITKTNCPYCKQPILVLLGKAARCAICKKVLFVTKKERIRA